jgi:hypothetical protein
MSLSAHGCSYKPPTYTISIPDWAEKIAHVLCMSLSAHGCSYKPPTYTISIPDWAGKILCMSLSAHGCSYKPPTYTISIPDWAEKIAHSLHEFVGKAFVLFKRRSLYVATNFCIHFYRLSKNWSTACYSDFKAFFEPSSIFYPEPNPSVARVEGNTKKIRSILRPSILRLFFGSVSQRQKVLPKLYENSTQLLRTSKEWRGLRFFFVSSFYLPPSPSPTQSYSTHFVPNSDEGL